MITFDKLMEVFLKSSLKLKIVFVLSLLMAVIFTSQLILLNNMQQDLYKELTSLTTNINKAGKYYFNYNQEVTRRILKKRLPADTASNHRFIRIQNVIKSNLEQNDGTVDLEDEEIFIASNVKNADSFLNAVQAKDKKNGLIWVDKLKELQKDGNLEIFIETIDSNRLLHTDNYKVQSDPDIKTVQPIYEFMIPHPAPDQQLSFLRFEYSPRDIQQAIDNIRFKSIIITLVLFILSIILIFIIIKRFLSPIQTLKYSFDRVESGDLDAVIPATSSDEIGDLTRAFNHMVHELKHIKEREIIINRKERLASLGQLAASVAHEIKNPLNAIQLNLEHLSDKIPDTARDKSKKYITASKNELSRLTGIVNHMLNFIKSENLERKKTDLNRLTEQILTLFEKEMEKHHIELIHEKSSPLFLMIDAEKMKTALVNIILNAVQAMPDGGQLTVTVNPQTQQLKIADTGPGIDEKEMERIFDLFYTTRPSGSGMGLPTAYKIIREHQGDIEISCEPGQGTIVDITLNSDVLQP